MNRNDDKNEITLFLIGSIVIVWLGILIAPYSAGGLPEIILNFSTALNNPFQITWCENSLKISLILLLIYILAIAVYFSNQKNYRRLEEYGSAKWGNPYVINKKYMQMPISENKILTQNLKLGLDGKKHRRNLNILVCRW